MTIKYKVFNALAVILILISLNTNAQITIKDNNIPIDYANPKEYEIGGITINGAINYDQKVLLMLTGLSVGDVVQIPGDKITKAIDNLWKQGMFEKITVSINRIENEIIFLDIDVQDKPRLSRFSFKGINKSEADNLREEIKLNRGDIVTEHLLKRSTYRIKKYLINKGFLNTEISITQQPDTILSNSVSLTINIKKHKKIRINQINFHGNILVSDGKLRHSMKNTKQKSIFKPLQDIDLLAYELVDSLFTKPFSFDMENFIRQSFNKRVDIKLKGSKFIEEDYKTDKASVIAKFNEMGFRDAKIISDSIYPINEKQINIDIYVEEGNKYYFRNIYWVGNTKYTATQLNNLLKIKKGEVYNQKLLQTNLSESQDGRDVSSLYLDDGYLFFSATPVETAVEKDSIDIEIRIHEGKQATINKIILNGNTKTNDNVVYREIRTKPGQLFSKSNLIRTHRELAQLRYFDAQKIGINPKPNPSDGTVDIEYTVEEVSSDQIELSGGWGAGRAVGTLGLSFNNFSAKNFFKKEAWQPLPSGDGQKLSIRAQTTGKWYQAYNFSFTEPWLGGKKPNSLSVGVYHSVQTNGISKKDAENDSSLNRQALLINGLSLGFGKRLLWPDDYFSAFHNLSYQNYILQDYPLISGFSKGNSNNISYTFTIGRNSTDAPLFPTQGADIMLSAQFTPPYSLFNNKDYDNLDVQERYKWVEFHKWKFNFSWFTTLAGKLVLNAKTKFGYLGMYNPKVGESPFERFYLGGDGLSGFALDGRELIGLRGYSNMSLTPQVRGNYVGASVFNKYTMELKYPLSLNPMATIYALTFAEGGNAWVGFENYNAFDIKRSAGVGVRIFLPMLGGLLGLDWGYGFDEVKGEPGANKGQFHFSINQSID